ncbi:efflux transporter outer membrane subunit [Pseudomonas oryzihabitans]|uniref:efflux transporter outer membrane subunit n=1 Tax=Pseudomonas oryzihabitans TaxID=47885 RepID=UPI00119EBA43|nr:efflux transporter outer membrane subunit [Pseudomonas oryzihabitans]
MAIANILALTALLAGCSLAPIHERPQATVPERYPVPAATSALLPDRQSLFADPRLRGLIDQALNGNRDLRLVVLDIQEARARYRISRADLMFELGATASRTRERTQSLDNAARTDQERAGSQTANRYSVGLGTNAYELDLFGRLRNLRDAALDEYLAQRVTRRAVELSLIAEVATAYLNQRALDERLTVSHDTLESRHRGLRLTEQLHTAGVSSALDLAQAQTSVETAAADLAALERSRAQADNTLRLLLGGEPRGDLPAPLPLAQQGLDLPVPAGLPSDLLQRRPDIRAAEYRLRAANANIGAARAAFFPRITLTASAGYLSSDLNGLFNLGNQVWSFVPQLQVPLFDGGRNRANLDLAEVRRDQNVARYEKSIQVAFREVADQLVAEAPLQRQLAAQRSLSDITARSVELASERYRQGLDNYLNLLDSQRSLYQADNALIETRLQLMVAHVELFRALGGEWNQKGEENHAGSAPEMHGAVPAMASR